MYTVYLLNVFSKIADALKPSRILSIGRSHVMAQRVQLIALFLAALASFSRAQQLCPRNCSLLTDSSNVIIVDMKCRSLGNLSQLPPSCNETRSIKVLTVGPDGTSVARIQGLAFSGLRIVKLVLENIKIQDLDADAFKGLGPSLEVLFLNDNLLSSLPFGLFSELAMLTTLQLHSNRLTSLWSIPVNSLNGVPPQTTVAGDNNSGAVEFSSALASLVNLQRLTAHDNRIENISSKVFASLGKLQDLTLQGNEIQWLSSDVFSSLRSLTNLNMSSNALTMLPNALFNFSQSTIKSIDFSSNKISLISEKALTFLPELTALQLQNNRLDELREDTFLGLKQLLTIRLNNNSINTTYSNSLTGMPLLRELHMQDNMIRVLPNGMFDPVGSLTFLNLSNNRINRIEKVPFSSQSNLKLLDVSNNALTAISSDWFLYTTNLDTLLLENNRISSINATSFDKTTNLRELNLTNNLLPEEQLRGRFTKCVSLQTLRLDGNPLGAITLQTFNGPPSLERLYLNSSCIRSAYFDWRPDSLPVLKELYLQNNFLERISSDAFAGLIQLKTMDLSHNELSVVEAGAFSAPASTLRLLNLTQNSLDDSQLSSLASTPLDGTTVDLSWNNIQGVEIFPNFGRVYLTGNPIACNCSSFQRLTDLSTFPDYATTVCSSGSSSHLVSQLLVCFLSNSTACDNQTTGLTLPNGICGKKLETDLTATFSRLRKQIRDRETARCASIIFTNVTTNATMPSLQYLDVIASDTTFNLSWRVDDVSRVIGFTVTWFQMFPENENVSSHVINDANQTRFVINHIEPRNNYTVCVRIMLAMNSTGAGANSKCHNVIGGLGTGCGGQAQCGGSQQNGFMPLILYIIIPVAVVLLIIIVVVVVVVIRHKQGAQKTPNEATSPHFASPATISKGTNGNLAEQATVSVNIFDY